MILTMDENDDEWLIDLQKNWPLQWDKFVRDVMVHARWDNSSSSRSPDKSLTQKLKVSHLLLYSHFSRFSFHASFSSLLLSRCQHVERSLLLFSLFEIYLFQSEKVTSFLYSLSVRVHTFYVV